MKVLYIAHVRLPTEKAHGVQIMKTCEALARRGAEVTLVVPWRRNSIQEDPFLYYDVEKNFAIRRLPALDLIFLGRWGFWIHLLTFAASVFWYALFSRADALYGRDEIPLLFASMGKRTIVWESHTGRYHFFIRLLLLRARLAVISKSLKDFYLGKGVPERRIALAPDGVDIELFDISFSGEEARKSLNLPLDTPIALYAGKFDKEKGFYTLLEASRSMPTVLTAVIGGTPGEVTMLQSEYPLVRFLGPRPYRELPKHQKAADALIIPNSGESPISREFTSPLKLFAHMASGIPIVASEVPSLRDVLDQDAAFFFEPDNPRSLAAAVEASLQNPLEGKKRAGKARKIVRGYTWERRAEIILKILAEKQPLS